MKHSTRRDFLQLAASALSATALGDSVLAQTGSASATGIPTRPLGKTGVRISILLKISNDNPSSNCTSQKIRSASGALEKYSILSFTLESSAATFKFASMFISALIRF